MVKCACCGTTTANPKFCSRSCAVTVHNHQIPKRVCEDRVCAGCGVKLHGYAKWHNTFCSLNCFQAVRWAETRNKILAGDVSVPVRQYRRFLIEQFGEKCQRCGWKERHPITKKVPLELEHKDGDSENNAYTNLALLCPNCHSLTPTYKGLNRGHGRFKRRERYRNGQSY